MILYMDSETVVLEKACPFCGTRSMVTLVTDEYAKWMDGMCIQDAMPFAPAETREFLISGMCRDCQENIFG